MRAFAMAISICIFSVLANAGIFGVDQPSKEFLKKDISCDYSCLAFSVEDFLKHGIKPGANISWEKDNSNWLMKISVKDKVSSSTVKMNILFSADTVTANISRLNINGEEIKSGMFPSYITPIGEEVYRKTGRENQLIAEIPIVTENTGPIDSPIPLTEKKILKQKSKISVESDLKLKQQTELSAKAKELELKKQAEDADRTAKAKELGEAIKSAVGSYKNSMADVGDEFSFYMNEGTMYGSYKNKKCEFKDRELNFPNVTNNNGLETKLKDPDCELSFSFSTLTSGVKAVSVNEGGTCKKFCSYSDGRSLSGRFQK